MLARLDDDHKKPAFTAPVLPLRRLETCLDAADHHSRPSVLCTGDVMDDDYYAPHATTTLAQPLVLIGGHGSGASQVAQAVCARTGLPFDDIDRVIEHMAGCSLAALSLRPAAGRHVELLRTALDQALRRRPCPVIALGPDGLRDPACRRRIAGAATLVYLYADAVVLARRASAQLREQPTRYYPALVDAGAATPARLAELLEERRGAYEAATLTIDIADRSPIELAMLLLGRLGL